MFNLKFIFLILILIISNRVVAQNVTKMPATIYKGDTIAVYTFKPVWCRGLKNFKSDLERYRYNQLKYNIKVVFPYVKEAGKIFNEINNLLPNMSNKEKRRFIAAKEVELRAKFEEPLKNLYDTQGKLLILLINRETGNSVYKNLREIKGNVKAALLESTALVNGINLGVKWDDQKYKWEEEIMEDLEIEYGYPIPMNRN